MAVLLIAEDEKDNLNIYFMFMYVTYCTSKRSKSEH